MDADEAAATVYERICRRDHVPLDATIARLLGIYAPPLPADATVEQAYDAYRRVIEG